MRSPDDCSDGDTEAAARKLWDDQWGDKVIKLPALKASPDELPLE